MRETIFANQRDVECLYEKHVRPKWTLSNG